MDKTQKLIFAYATIVFHFIYGTTIFSLVSINYQHRLAIPVAILLGLSMIIAITYHIFVMLRIIKA
jgi:hypothetical protein